MLSMEGRCKTLDSRADGYARSEGCGVLLLSTLAPQAYTYQAGPCAVIVGSAVNQVRVCSSSLASNSMFKAVWKTGRSCVL